MGSVLCSQNDDSGVNAFNCKHFPTFYVFEHITCFYHGISSLGNSQGAELSTYFLLPSVPADEPPTLPKSTKGTAPPETCGRMPFHSRRLCPNRCFLHLFTSRHSCARPPGPGLFWRRFLKRKIIRRFFIGFQF